VGETPATALGSVTRGAIQSKLSVVLVPERIDVPCFEKTALGIWFIGGANTSVDVGQYAAMSWKVRPPMLCRLASHMVLTVHSAAFRTPAGSLSRQWQGKQFAYCTMRTWPHEDPPGETQMKDRKQLVYLGMVLTSLAGCGVQDPHNAQPNSAAQSNANRALARRLAQIAGQTNQAAPANIDSDTRLDAARAGPGLKLTITYTLVNSESDGTNSTTFETKLTPVIKKASCTNPDLRSLIDQGVVVDLEYRGNAGKPIGTISVNRDTCGALK
jgi:hypothetical protein